jgi:microcystin-dependent protein
VSSTTSLATTPQGNCYSQSTQATLYIDDVPNVQMATSSIGPAGGSQPHENTQPFLCINFIISLFGVFPSQT